VVPVSSTFMRVISKITSTNIHNKVYTIIVTRSEYFKKNNPFDKLQLYYKEPYAQDTIKNI